MVATSGPEDLREEIMEAMRVFQSRKSDIQDWVCTAASMPRIILSPCEQTAKATTISDPCCTRRRKPGTISSGSFRASAAGVVNSALFVSSRAHSQLHYQPCHGFQQWSITQSQQRRGPPADAADDFPVAEPFPAPVSCHGRIHAGVDSSTPHRDA